MWSRQSALYQRAQSIPKKHRIDGVRLAVVLAELTCQEPGRSFVGTHTHTRGLFACTMAIWGWVTASAELQMNQTLQRAGGSKTCARSSRLPTWVVLPQRHTDPTSRTCLLARGDRADLAPPSVPSCRYIHVLWGWGLDSSTCTPAETYCEHSPLLKP